MQNRILFALLVMLGLATPAMANDVTAITFMPTDANTGSLPSSPLFGTFPPFTPNPVNDCGGNTLAAGVHVFTDGAFVTGIRLRCRNFGIIGATDTSTVFDQPLMGTKGTSSVMLECDSGEAMTGLRVRSGLFVDALGISCHSVSPDFTTTVAFRNDGLFGSGRGSVVNAGSSSMTTTLVGGPGGDSASFECGSSTPFIRALQAAVPDRDHIWGIRALCSKVMDKPLDTSATRADLAVRTIGQRRIVSAGSTDGFRAEVFNLGGPIPNPGDTAYVELIFSSTDITFTVVPPACSFISSGRIRCPLPSPDFEDGQVSSLGSFTFRALHARPEAAVFVVQASFEIDDTNYSNNTYGFFVTLQ